MKTLATSGLLCVVLMACTDSEPVLELGGDAKVPGEEGLPSRPMPFDLNERGARRTLDGSLGFEWEPHEPISQLDGGYTLDSATCEVAASPPPDAGLPCVDRYFRADGSKLHQVQLDRIGRVLDQAHWDPAGAIMTRRTTRFGPHGPEQETHRSGEHWVRETIWSYLSSGQLDAVRHDHGNFFVVEQYRYDSSGRLTQVDWTETGPDGLDPTNKGIKRFTYDSNRRLLGTQERDERGNERSEAWEYYASGIPSRYTWQSQPCCYGSEKSTTEFDLAGQVIRSSGHTASASHDRVFEYAERNLIRDEGFVSGDRERSWLHRWEFDDASRLTRHRWASDVDSFASSRPRLSRVTARYVNDCASGALLREEIDTDEDGEIDGLRTVAHDSFGRPVAEQFTGTMPIWVGQQRLAADFGAVRRELDYGCHP